LRAAQRAKRTVLANTGDGPKALAARGSRLGGPVLAGRVFEKGSGELESIKADLVPGQNTLYSAKCPPKKILVQGCYLRILKYTR
jgi:hypothetical protein